MIKFFGKNNDLRTEDGKITGTGYQNVFEVFSPSRRESS